MRRASSSPEDRRIAAWARKTLGVTPRDTALYRQALRHSSAVPEDRVDLPNNERLEFLGDAILDAIVGDLLFNSYPDKEEGFLTRMRSKLVSRQQLNMLARKIGIERVMESNVEGGHETSVPGNALEAVIGALFLDKGFERTRRSVVSLITGEFALKELEQEDRDSKSRLLEWGQKNRRKVEFRVAEEAGRSSRGRIFLAEVLVDGRVRGRGKGTGKKKAEQEAADAAMRSIRSRAAQGRSRRGERPDGEKDRRPGSTRKPRQGKQGRSARRPPEE
ncbi:MAG: ribonuclease III [Flavobacteriales bacterium]|nr:ribonuclease III [Flavobacteriales bacterium]MCB9167045.1 ribonuclease III [Flavobacteriales bacterium]